MIIKVIIIISIVLAMAWFLVNRNTHQARAWKKIAVCGLASMGVIVVLAPDTANQLAKLVGVGRGADLLLYLLTLAFIFSSLSLYMKHKEDEKLLVVLARKIALLEAKINNK